MTKRNNEKRKNALNKRSDIETLEFQTLWGLKKLLGNTYYTYTACIEAELHFIIELNLYAESGMDKESLKKRFAFLVWEKINSETAERSTN